ncbi:hypothetical protein [Pedobacter antarcticus]|uniref:hypothetical protein n=1 Tax=Pedobacter antarcticus TaxID=34086 RepID=UPI00292DF3E6|nr:hypothetical protein [Pedobacter antarcticus]
MGFTVAPKITVATAEGPVTIKTDDITAIAIAPDLGANVTFVEDGDTKTVLTVESFLRVISYFHR